MAPSTSRPRSVGPQHGRPQHDAALARQHDLNVPRPREAVRGITARQAQHWSMGTDEGENLLDPGHDPHANAQFWPSWLRVTPRVNVHATCSAPASRTRATTTPWRERGAPAIVSIFTPAHSSRRESSSAKGRGRRPPRGAATWSSGVTSLPVLPKDATDRNRTSPFASPATSFEFRAVARPPPSTGPRPSSTAPWRTRFRSSADELEKLEHGDFEGLTRILSRIVKANKQFLFEGNNYAEDGTPRLRSAGWRTTSDRRRRVRPDQAKAKDLPRVRRAVRARAGRPRRDQWESYVKVQNIEAQLRAGHPRTLILARRPSR